MDLALLFVTMSLGFNLPPGLLSAVCYTESNHNPKAFVRHDGNGTPSYGLCMVKENTARMLGFKGKTKDLMLPGVNTYYAAKYLEYQHNRYGSWAKAVTAYNKGRSDSHGGSAYTAKVFNALLEQRNSELSRTQEVHAEQPRRSSH